MVKFNPDIESGHLNDHFGISKEDFEAVAPVWNKTQDEINAHLTECFSEPSGEYEGRDGVMFDAAPVLDIFFKHFNTQELQDAALIQLLSKDIQNRAEHHVHMSAKFPF